MTDKKSIRLSVTDITKKNAIQLVRDTSSKKITAYFLTSDFLGAHPNIRFMWLRFDDDEPIKLFAGYYIEGQVMLPTEMQAALLSKLPTVKRIRVRTTRYDQVIVDSEFKITDLYGQAAMFKKDCGLLS
ncbi:hypothetical protein [Sphingobium sp. DN12]|uniref:hypothetical protein n=1 Tax=Sphingobium sp. DN12 TaxID=3378073 RepID=UPI003DA35C7C